MNRYMLLLYADEKGGEALSPQDMAMWMDKMGEFGAALEKANALVSTGGLGRTRHARTVHQTKDGLQVHNGPYVETQEQLGGYYLIEAADMDGATGWQKFWRITLPQLGPTTFFVSVMLTIGSFKVFDQIYMITQGGPGTSTLVLVYHIYNEAFVSWDLGYSSMVALVLFLLVLAITILQFRWTQRNEEDFV